MLFLKCAAQRAFSVSGSWRIFHKLQFQNKLRFSERLSQMLSKTNSDFKTHTHPQKKKVPFREKKTKMFLRTFIASVSSLMFLTNFHHK